MEQDFFSTQPPGCRCDPSTWLMPWWPVCSHFEPIGDQGRCGQCNHDEACHTAPADTDNYTWSDL